MAVNVAPNPIPLIPFGVPNGVFNPDAYPRDGAILSLLFRRPSTIPRLPFGISIELIF